MAIKFLQDYSTKAHPPEHFALGQVVSGREEASEGHFVSRGYAAFLVDGKLIDRFGKEVADPASAKAEKAVTPPTDDLSKIDVARANKAQLLAIAGHEGVELPEGDETTVKELRALIAAKRAAPPVEEPAAE